MSGSIDLFTCEGYHCSVYVPEQYIESESSFPVVYVNGVNDIREIVGAIEPYFYKDCPPFILVNIQPKNWNDDYTPWAAKGIARDGEDFGGKADNYIETLLYKIKPYIDTNYRTKSDYKNNVLLGYSLGGLLSLYALYSCACFGKVGSLSGSLWYEEWIEYMSLNNPYNKDAKVYLSLGIKESKSRNPRMANVGVCTEKAFEMLQKQLSSEENVKLEWNNGGHFTEITERFIKAILWLVKDL
ncbi:alpha/beta hydrolase [Clostridium fungisolvens]|uniref:Esterase n=1 Tax=Clostridium fungisolvens TaxID=1604897 RepID=A0A6V8SDA3_9CLOT|nr:alpha/beta hydrolase-fold protein [Clostridium fungisolvens]GFP75219.1 putative protein YbbA [Clostridium fungisolvens]